MITLKLVMTDRNSGEVLLDYTLCLGNIDHRELAFELGRTIGKLTLPEEARDADHIHRQD